MRVRVTLGSLRTEGGKSHSWVTPTSSFSSPRAQTISVALGRSETILMGRSWRDATGAGGRSLSRQRVRLIIRHLAPQRRGGELRTTPLEP
jgi:hypothetical protein